MGILECQWQLLQAPYQVGLKIMEAVGKVPDASPPGAARTVEEEVRLLEQQALERVRKGLAPPRKIYEVPYRNRIDWSAFPDWARPSDPELYEGCGHEG
jgi:hypothetical protein